MTSERWPIVTLGEIAKWGSGGTPRATVSQYYDGGTIPWAVIGDLNDGVVYDCKTKITQAGLDESSAKLIDVGSILVAMYGSIGKLGVAGIRLATNQAIAFAIPDEERVLPRFLFWYLYSQRSLLLAAGKGATQQNISQTVLKAWPIPVPSIERQRQIVATIEEHFSRLDAADSALGRAETQIDRLQRSFHATLLRSDWPKVHLRDVVISLRNGLFVPRPSSEPVGTRIFRISAVRPGHLDLEDVRFIPNEEPTVANYVLHGGDLLFTRYNGNSRFVGACAVVPHRMERTVYPDKLIRAVPNRSKVIPEFVALYLNDGEGRREIERRLKTTAGQVGIAGEQLLNLPIYVPPLDIQQRIVAQSLELAAACDRQRFAIKVLRRRCRRLRQSAIAKTFSQSDTSRVAAS